MASFLKSAAAAAVVAFAATGGTFAQTPPPPMVSVETLSPQFVTLTTTLPGRVHASSEAEVRPQVGGIVIERLFDEGSLIEAGEPLYRIDPVSYEAAVAQARLPSRRPRRSCAPPSARPSGCRP